MEYLLRITRGWDEAHFENQLHSERLPKLLFDFVEFLARDWAGPRSSLQHSTTLMTEYVGDSFLFVFWHQSSEHQIINICNLCTNPRSNSRDFRAKANHCVICISFQEVVHSAVIRYKPCCRRWKDTASHVFQMFE